MPASPLDILWAAVELADEGSRDERGFLTEQSQAAVSAALAELPSQQAQLSLAEQEFLGDILMAWVSTGTTNAQGLKGWRDDATGEYRYQEIQPGTRKPGQEETPGEPRVKKPEEATTSTAGKQEPQQPKGQVPEKKEPAPAQPKKPELNPQAQAILKQHQAAAQKDAQDPKHAVNRFKDQLADFTPPGGAAIKTVQSTQEKPLTAEDHQQVAAFHNRMASIMELLGQEQLAQSNKMAAQLHQREAEAKTPKVVNEPELTEEDYQVLQTPKGPQKRLKTVKEAQAQLKGAKEFLAQSMRQDFQGPIEVSSPEERSRIVDEYRKSFQDGVSRAEAALHRAQEREKAAIPAAGVLAPVQPSAPTKTPKPAAAPKPEVAPATPAALEYGNRIKAAWEKTLDAHVPATEIEPILADAEKLELTDLIAAAVHAGIKKPGNSKPAVLKALRAKLGEADLMRASIQV